MLLVIFAVLTVIVALLVCMEIGRRLRRRHLSGKEGSDDAGVGVVEGAIFGLLGLLLAFAFSGADSRFDARRQLIVTETNAIGTAWLRVDLLPADAQPQIRADFRHYVDLRLAFYRNLSKDRNQSRADLAASNEMQAKIWAESVAAAKQVPSPAVMTLVLSSLNDMIDITTTRSVALVTHPPVMIYALLLILALAGALLAGYGMADRARRPWLHTIAFAVTLAITLYTIADLEFPRFGLIRVDRYDAALVNQRNSMN